MVIRNESIGDRSIGDRSIGPGARKSKFINRFRIFRFLD